MPLLGFTKSAVRKKQREIIDLIDRDLKNQLGFILAQTEITDDMRLVRWKLRRFLEDLAGEFSLDISETGISVKALELANPKPPAIAKVEKPIRRPGRRTKRLGKG